MTESNILSKPIDLFNCTGNQNRKVGILTHVCSDVYFKSKRHNYKWNPQNIKRLFNEMGIDLYQLSQSTVHFGGLSIKSNVTQDVYMSHNLRNFSDNEQDIFNEVSDNEAWKLKKLKLNKMYNILKHGKGNNVKWNKIKLSKEEKKHKVLYIDLDKINQEDNPDPVVKERQRARRDKYLEEKKRKEAEKAHVRELASADDITKDVASEIYESDDDVPNSGRSDESDTKRELVLGKDTGGHHSEIVAIVKFIQMYRTRFNEINYIELTYYGSKTGPCDGCLGFINQFISFMEKMYDIKVKYL